MFVCVCVCVLAWKLLLMWNIEVSAVSLGLVVSQECDQGLEVRVPQRFALIFVLVSLHYRVISVCLHMQTLEHGIGIGLTQYGLNWQINQQQFSHGGTKARSFFALRTGKAAGVSQSQARRLRHFLNLNSARRNASKNFFNENSFAKVPECSKKNIHIIGGKKDY